VTAKCVRAGDMILDGQCLHLCVIDEATHVVKIVQLLLSYPDIYSDVSVISPYSAQVIVFALVNEMRRNSWDL